PVLITSTGDCPSTASPLPSRNSAAVESPRKPFIAASGTDLHLLLDQRAQLGRHLRQRLPRDRRLPIGANTHRDIESPPISARFRIVVASVGTSALLALDRR